MDTAPLITMGLLGNCINTSITKILAVPLLFYTINAGFLLYHEVMAIIPIIQISCKMVCLTRIFTPEVGPKGQMTLHGCAEYPGNR
jgi:hypothetical protein